jgi:hypothetical protein
VCVIFISPKRGTTYVTKLWLRMFGAAPNNHIGLSASSGKNPSLDIETIISLSGHGEHVRAERRKVAMATNGHGLVTTWPRAPYPEHARHQFRHHPYTLYDPVGARKLAKESGRRRLVSVSLLGL